MISVTNVCSLISQTLKGMDNSQIENVCKVSYLKYLKMCVCTHLWLVQTADSTGSAKSWMNQSVNERTFLFHLENKCAHHHIILRPSLLHFGRFLQEGLLRQDGKMIISKGISRILTPGHHAKRNFLFKIWKICFCFSLVSNSLAFLFFFF